MVVAILVFIALLLLLVLVHEFGHFIVAKWAGCRVNEFGFGFPPRLFSIKRGDTEYSFNLLPIGGFVKIEGEDMENATDAPTNFANKSALWRIAILAAGVIMNVVLAAVLLSIQAGVGFPTLATDENQAGLRDTKTYILEVVPDTPAAQAGVKALDRVVLLQGKASPSVEEIQKIVAEHAGKPITLEIERQGEHKTLELVPRVNPPAGQGALGVSLASTGLVKVPWWQAPWAGLTRTWEMLVAIVTQFGLILAELFKTRTVNTALTGPIGIAVYTNEATKLGLSYILEFGALISLNLAIVNILPLPALDGGRIVFVLLEKLRRKRLPMRFEQLTHTVGFALLILLMLLITAKDIKHYLF